MNCSFKVLRKALTLAGLAIFVSGQAARAQSFFEETFASYGDGAYVTNSAFSENGWQAHSNDLSRVISTNYSAESWSGTSSSDGYALELNTEGNTLSAPLSIGAVTQTYLDMMVNMVPSEDNPATNDLAAAKVGVFANTNGNLMVYHTYGDANPSNRFTEVALSAAEKVTNAWRRLTITLAFDKEIPAVGDFFKIQLDGGDAIVSDYAYSTPEVEFMAPTGVWFRCANKDGSNQGTITNFSVKGTGYLDNMLVAEGSPSAAYHEYEFQLDGFLATYTVQPGLVNPVDDDFASMTPGQLRIAVATEKDMAYTGMVRVAAVEAAGVQLWAKDTLGNWFDINVSGWGPAGGFQIDTNAVTEVYVVATNAFTAQNLTLVLTDLDGDYGAVDNKIIDQVEVISAEEAPTYIDGAPASWVNTVWPDDNYPTDFSGSTYNSLGEMWLVGQTNENVAFEIVSVELTEDGFIKVAWYSAESPNGVIQILSTDDLSTDIGSWNVLPLNIGDIVRDDNDPSAPAGQGVNSWTSSVPLDPNLFYRVRAVDTPQ